MTEENLTKIKICGLTDIQEAAWVREEKVEFAGMVLFFPKSKRNISVSRAKDILDALGDGIKKVAVVVSPSVEQVEMIQGAGFDLIQIHGKVSEDVLEALTIPFLRAFNVDNMQELELYQNQEKCAGFVFDAQTPGSGQTFDWTQIPTLPASDKIMLLAGGLHPGNVKEAVEKVHPYGVDVSSGVERQDGSGKDFDKIRAFVSAVRNSNHSVRFF